MRKGLSRKKRSELEGGREEEKDILDRVNICCIIDGTMPGQGM